MPVCCLKLHIPTSEGFLCCPHNLGRSTLVSGFFVAESCPCAGDRAAFCYVKQSKNLNVPFPRPFGATGNDARKLHAHGFARFRGVLSAHEVSCGVTAVSNKIICIAREFGSGGHEIAVRAGDKLGIKVYEKDIFHLACHYGGPSEQLIASAD